MREFHKQKIDEATVKNVQIPSGTFWLLIFGRSSRCHSLPPSPRLHLGGGTGFETVALWLCINFPFFFFHMFETYYSTQHVSTSPKFSHKDPRIDVPQSQRLASASLPPSQWCPSPSPSPCSASASAAASAAWGLCQDPDLLPLDTNMLAAATHDIFNLNLKSFLQSVKVSHVYRISWIWCGMGWIGIWWKFLFIPTRIGGRADQHAAHRRAVQLITSSVKMLRIRPSWNT